MKNLKTFIKKSHIKALEKFNDELEAWEKETGESPATLYEDANTSFTLSDVRVYYYLDGRVEMKGVVYYDEEEKTYFEAEGIDSIMEYVKFWRACLRRAKRYWQMDSDKLDAIQDGEMEDEEEEE